jgi:hypothetical protein
MNIDPSTVTAAEVLDNMETIVRNEMVQHVGYVTDTVVRHDLAESGSICRGHQACAVGSLWLAGGVEFQEYYGLLTLPGVECSYAGRIDWLEANDYWGLLEAYEALEAAAQEYLDSNALVVNIGQRAYGALESLFESYDEEIYDEESDGYLIEPHQLVDVIARARELLS